MPHLWLRAETKPNEHRTALTPSVVKQLLAQGFQVTVEKAPQSTFDDHEYVAVGATLVETGTWRTAPSDAYIIGLKELPENDTSPLPHTHIFFAHCYKGQDGWKDVLSRFDRGQGTLLDLEFLQDDNGRRVAAFGYHAGYAGSALGIDSWCHRQLRASASEAYPAQGHYKNDKELIAYMKTRLADVKAKTGLIPKIMVMGALGRCGRGACDFARDCGIPDSNIVKWDMAETKAGGPFKEIGDNEIFVNCIYLSSKIPPFVTKETLSQPGRVLEVIVDVSCDATNPNNPIPIYYGSTTFDKPIITADCSPAPSLDVIAIDHLPTLLPRESSDAFSNDLLPTLLALKDRSASNVWNRAEALFKAKTQESKA